MKWSMVTATIVEQEARRFGELARDWWDPNGASAMLHKLNPVRLQYVRDQLDRQWQFDECALKPLEGKRALDVGCGAGLLAEPLCRLGAQVTGLDASAELIAVAKQHAERSRLAIDYRTGELADLAGQYDLVTCMEVIEHVADPAHFIHLLSARLAAGGLLILSTPNATAWSKLLMIAIAEGAGRIPAGTHDFQKFIPPERMRVLLADAGLTTLDIEGIAWSPARGLHLSDDLRLNYLLTAVRG